METNPWTIIRKYQFPLLLVGIGILIYANSLFGQPIWDDTGYVFDNADFTHVSLVKIFTDNIYVLNGYYRPLVAFYYSVMLFFFGHQTFFFHAFQLMVHITNAFFLMLVFKKFLPRMVSFFSALVFLVHPLTVEAVAYIAAFDDVGSFFFGITGLYVLLYKQISKKMYGVMYLLFLSALLIKESAIVFLILSIVYVALYHRQRIKHISILMASVLGSYFLIRLGFVGIAHHASPLTPIASMPFFERMLSLPMIFFYYLSNVFFPWKLAIDQQWIVLSPNFLNFYFPLSFLIGFLALLIAPLWWLARKKQILDAYIFFLCWFAMGIGMHLQIFPLDMTVADRWFYIPLAGLLGLMGVFVYRFIRLTRIAYISVGIIICLLSFRTMFRNTNWTDRLTLYLHDAKNTNSFELDANTAAELIDAKHFDEALFYARRSVSTLPLDYNTYDLGALYEITNKPALAKEYYYKALSAKSHPIAGHRHILELYQGVGEFSALNDSPENAINILRQGINDYPNDAIVWMYLGVAAYKGDDQKLAESASKKAYDLSQTANTTYVKNQIFQHLPLVVTTKLGASQTILTPGNSTN